MEQRVKYSWGIALGIVLLLFVFQLTLLGKLFQVESKIYIEKFSSTLKEEIGRLNVKWSMFNLQEDDAICFSTETHDITVILENKKYTVPIDKNENENDIPIRASYDVCREHWKLNTLDSNVCARMNEIYESMPYQLVVKDSMGKIIETTEDKGMTINPAMTQVVFPLGYVTGRTLTGYCYFPWGYFWNSKADRIIMVFGLFVLLIGGVFFLIRTIIIQKRTAVYREDFMHIVAHDLKSPICFIRTSNYVIREKSPIPYTTVQLQMYEEADERLNLMLKSLQQLLMHSAGLYGLGLEKKEVNLKDEIERVINQYRMIAGERVHFILDYQSPAVLVTIDPLHFMGAITNLVDNAVKYSGEESEIKISCETDEKQMIIRVKDDGPGIPVTEEKFVFKKYYRIENKQHGKKGFGLGLNYVWQVVRAHHGSIKLVNQTGKGCEFIIRLPWEKRNR